MHAELIQALTTTFEAHAQQTEDGVEYWLARYIQHLLGYDEWRNFSAVVAKAKVACEVSGHTISDHFVDVNKTIQMPKSAERDVPDLMLTRFACYRIAQNGDSRREENSAPPKGNSPKSSTNKPVATKTLHSSREHITNNEAVRNTLLERGIRPEALPADEYVKRVDHHLVKENKDAMQDPDGLGIQENS